MQWKKEKITIADGTKIDAQAPIIISASRSTDYTVPHCQDHLKKILIPPIYDTLSNMSIASNS